MNSKKLRNLIRSVAASFCTLLFIQSAAAAGDDVFQFNWTRVVKDRDGKELAVTVTKPKKTKAVVKKPDGKTETTDANVSLRLMGNACYRAELPETIRQQPLFVDFSFSGTAGSSAEQGSVVNIDGAVIGLQLRPGAKRADVMVLDIGSEGQHIWRRAGWGLPIDAAMQVTAAPRMAVRLDPKNARWSLYYRDVLVIDGLPLLSARGKPTISVSPGTVDTDMLILRRIRIGTKPSLRSKEFLPAGPDGKIDFAKARAEHDPRVEPPGKTFSNIKQSAKRIQPKKQTTEQENQEAKK